MPVRIAAIQKSTKINAGEGVEKRDPSYTVVGMQTSPATMDLIDRVPDELWMEVPDIVPEAVIKTILLPPKMQKNEMAFEEALQIAVKRRDVKAKKERKDMPI